MIKALFSIDAFVNEITSWNKKKKLLSSLINKHKFFKRPHNTFLTTRYGKDTFNFCDELMKILHEDFKKFWQLSMIKMIIKLLTNTVELCILVLYI